MKSCLIIPKGENRKTGRVQEAGVVKNQRLLFWMMHFNIVK